VCIALFKVELNLASPVLYPAFYSSMTGSYIVTQGLTGSPRVVHSLYSRALPARSRKLCLPRRGARHVLSSCHVALGQQRGTMLSDHLAL
jgi:hypothetical protein